MQSSHGSEREDRDGGAVAAEENEEPQRDYAGELAEMEERWKRARADLDNYRKRTAAEVDRRVTEARDEVLRDWLEALDSVERALRLEPENALAGGLRAVLDQMEAILAREGVKRIGAVDEQFDPERHEVVAVRDTDAVPDRTVVEVTRSGFAHGDRLLRPAQVVVARHDEREG